MVKKLLMISLMLFGLVVGATNVLAIKLQPPPVPVGNDSAERPTEAVSFNFDYMVDPSTTTNGIGTRVMIDPSTIAEVNLGSGTRSIHVKKVQEALKALGYLPSNLETTEYLGPKTKEAITNFQKAQGLPATGFFGPATRNNLRKVLTGGWESMTIDKNVDIACMKTAVEKRENALLSAYDIYSPKLKTVRETRKTDLLAAWSIQDPKERYTAIKVAWEKFRKGVKTATTEWNQSRKTIWDQFAKDAKNCKATIIETQNMESVPFDNINDIGI